MSKKCKQAGCNESAFTPRTGIHKSKFHKGFCVMCILKIDRELKSAKSKEPRKTKRKSDVVKLQDEFNKITKQRDSERVCISCDKPVVEGEKRDAGHFRKVSTYTAIRFLDFNVNSQCVWCNQHLDGNEYEYGVKLPDRIGQSNFDLLEHITQLSKQKTGLFKFSAKDITDMRNILKEHKVKGLEMIRNEYYVKKAEKFKFI